MVGTEAVACGRETAPNTALHLTASSLRSVRREAVWKNVETPLGIQVPIEPLELSTLDHSRV